MKFVLVAVLSLAFKVQASYPPAIPAPVYGVPEAIVKSVVPATVYDVPEVSTSVVTPIKTEYSYAVASVPEVHHEVIAAPVAPAAPVVPSVRIEGPSTYTSVVGAGLHHVEPQVYTLGHTPLTSFYHGLPSLYTSGYSGYFPSLYSSYIQPTLGYSSLNPYSYGYSVPHVPYQSAEPSVNIIGPKVSYVQPSPVTTVISGSEDDSQYHEELYAEKLEAPVITKVVVQEVAKPVVPHTTYGLPY